MFPPEQRLSLLSNWSAAIKRVTRENPIAGGLVTTWSDRGVSLRTTPVGSGLSGGTVYRVDVVNDAASCSHCEDPRSWALKAWPPATSTQQIARVAAIVRAAAPHCDLLAPPLPRDRSDSTALMAYGQHWELARWIPGTPLPKNATAASIALGGEAISRVHEAMNREHRADSFRFAIANRSVPRCITDRITRIQALAMQITSIAGQMPAQDKLSGRLATQLTTEQPGDPASEFNCGELAKTLHQAAGWLARQWPSVIPQLVERLHEHSHDREKLASCWVLRDVHREHVLFADDGTVAGILDYDAVDWDSPAADLARWAGDFDTAEGPSIDQSAGPPPPPGSASPLYAAVAGYRRIRPFSQSEWDLAQTLIDVNRVGGLANWLVWLIAGNRQFTASAQQIQSRISHLIASDCRIC